MKAFMVTVFIVILFGITFGGCAGVKPSSDAPMWRGKECRQIGGNFVENEVYFACPLYNKELNTHEKN